MAKALDVIGKTFNRLTVIEFVGQDKDRNYLYRCKCTCGKETVVAGSKVKRGRAKSCGCLDYEQKVTHGLSQTRGYDSWKNMMNRCYDKDDKSYPQYGGRGIEVCPEWHSVEQFFADMGVKPAGHELDRKDNELGYSKDNCQWVMRIVNARNKQKSKWWVVAGVKYESSYDAAEAHQVCQTTIINWCEGHVNRGVSYPPRDNCYSEMKYETS